MGEKCVEKDNCTVTLSDSEKTLLWKASKCWERESFQTEDSAILDNSSVIDKAIKMWRQNVSGQSGIIAEMFKISDRVWYSLVTKTPNYIFPDTVVPSCTKISYQVTCVI